METVDFPPFPFILKAFVLNLRGLSGGLGLNRVAEKLAVDGRGAKWRILGLKEEVFHGFSRVVHRFSWIFNGF